MKRPDIQCDNHPDHPLLSVIIPSYNSEEFLEDCLESVTASVDPRVEFLFIDGGSTDRTPAIVEKYRSLFTHFISEPDNGQSNALNKGFGLSAGQYLTWLNADDILLPQAMGKVLDFLEKETASWYACNQVYINTENQITRVLESGKFEKYSWRFGVMHVFGPSTLFAKSLFLEMGSLDEDYRYCMDYEYWYRLCSAGFKYVRLPVHLWGFRVHEQSKTSGTLVGKNSTPHLMQVEQGRIRKKYLNNKWLQFKRLALFLVRVKRFVTGPYMRSWLLSRKYKGTSYLHFNEN